MSSYCYWSIATGAHGQLMERCVQTARKAGVFKQFHVLTDRQLLDCECYEAFALEKEYGLYKLHYLKAGVSRLPFDYLVWIDADSVFVKCPLDILRSVARSPIHVPLEVKCVDVPQQAVFRGVCCTTLQTLYSEAGIVDTPYLCRSAFWIVRRDAIDVVFELAFQFVNLSRAKGILVHVDAALGYAMQILCADPEAHCLASHSELWASDDFGVFGDNQPTGAPWAWKNLCGDDTSEINPAIIHLPRNRLNRTLLF
jgi:hypothetical protein